MKEKEEFNFKDYFYILFSKKWIILSIFGVTIFSTLWYTHTTPKVYQAEATLLISTETPFPGHSPYYPPLINIRNYCEILKSKTVARRGVKKLKEEGREIGFLLYPEPENILLSRISIKPIGESSIIKIYGTANNPEEAAIITNAFVDAFIEEQLLTVKAGFIEQTKYLEEQIPIVEEKLRKSEKKIREFKEKNKTAFLGGEEKEAIRKLAEFDRLYGESIARYNSIKKRLEELKNQLTEEKKNMVEEMLNVSSLHIINLRRELTSLERAYSSYLTQGLDEEDPRVQEIKNSIERIKNKLREETKKIASEEMSSFDPVLFSQQLIDNILYFEIELSSEEAIMNTLKEFYQKYDSILLSLPKINYELAQLEREKELNSNIYAMLIESYRRAQVTSAGITSNVRIIDKAEIPKYPIKPNKKLNLALGIILGLILSLGSVFLLEYMGGVVRTEKEAKVITNLPIIGVIPKIKSKKDPILAECYKNLRTNINFFSPDTPVKAIAISSSLPQEGKTTVTYNIAISMAQLEKKVLVVDADLRKPSIKNFFDIKTNPGLVDILINKSQNIETIYWEAIHSTIIENLYVIPAGKIPPNPAELIASNKMKNLIKELKKEFDFIVFDTPPIINVTDASILAAELDGIILVVEINKTPKNAIIKAKENIERVQGKILGILLNKVPFIYTPYYKYPYRHSRT